MKKLQLKVSGQEVFKAGNLNNALSNFEVLNPELVIFRMEPDVKLQMELTINKGRGYVPAEENEPVDSEFGLIAIDSIFTPDKKCKIFS